MFRFVGNQLLKINLSSTEKFDGVRKICVNSCVHLRSRAEELAEKKRRDEENNWNKLYLYNDMKYLAILTKLKLYSYVSTAVLVPAAYAVQMSQTFPDFSATPSLAIGLTSVTVATLYSKALANTIGIMYACEQNKNLRVAYIDFWGNQIFVDTTVEEVRKWKKSPLKFNLYKTVDVNNGKEKLSLKLPWKNVEINNTKLFRHLFGK